MHKRCKKKCKHDAVKNLKCRLPYMDYISNIELCTSKATADHAKKFHVKKMDECKCGMRCFTTLPEFTVDNPSTISVEGRDVYSAHRTNKIIKFQEHFAYSFMRLLADVGNLISMTLEICIIYIFSTFYFRYY